MLPLARALAGRYAGRGEPLDDLVQVACIGIMKAIEGFDLEARGALLVIRYAPTVLGEIKRHFRDRTWAMRVRRRGMQELQLKIAKARDKLTDLARALADGAGARRRGRGAVRGCSPDAAVRWAPGARARSTSPTGEDRDMTLANAIGAEDPEMGRTEIRVLLDGAMQVLPANATARSCGCASRKT